jgi:hypothetical protein
MHSSINARSLSAKCLRVSHRSASRPTREVARSRPVSLSENTCTTGKMMVLKASELDATQLKAATARPRINFESILQTVCFVMPSEIDIQVLYY